MSARDAQLIGGGGRWITNPKHLPAIAVEDDKLGLKSSPTTGTTSDLAGFFTALALRGATASISVADTYVTVANLTGSGFITNLISPTHSAAFLPTIRITLDGTVYTIAPSANQTAFYRIVLGPLLSYQSVVAIATAATAGDVIGPNSAADFGFSGSKVGGLVQAPLTSLLSVPTPEAIMSMGWPALRFESSCLIEMKASLLSGTAVEKQCGVTYRLDL